MGEEIASKRDVAVLSVFIVFILGIFSLTSVAQGGKGGQSVAPVISNVAATYITPWTAIIIWTTDVPTTGMAVYGTQANSMGNGSGGSPGPVTAHAAVFSNLSPSTKYYFYVNATNQVTNTFSKSKTFSFTTAVSAPRDTTAPVAPTIVGTAVSTSQINLSWSGAGDPSGIGGYDVLRNGSVIAIMNGVTNSYSDRGDYGGGLAAGTTYRYTVRTFDGAGNYGLSSPATITTLGGSPPPPPPPEDTTPPSVPENLSGSAVSSSQVSLTWVASTDNVGVTGYRIYRNGTQIAARSTTNYNDTGLAASTAYGYTVAAYDASGNISMQSYPTSVTTLLGTSTTATSTP